MKKQKNAKPDHVKAEPILVDEAEFTEVIRKMVNTSPVERKDVEGRSRYRRKKNPNEGPLFPATNAQRD